MPNLNPNPNPYLNQSTSANLNAEYKAPNVSDEQLAIMTGVKIDAQVALAEKKRGHFPNDEEFTLWLAIYGVKVNDYFFEHPETTIQDLDKIEQFINKDLSIH